MEMNLITLNFGPVVLTNRKDSAWIDLETRKVSIKPYLMPSGEYLNKIWEPIAIGLGYIDVDGNFIIEVSYNWTDWTFYFSDIAQYQNKLIYSATREFDEMIAKGRFTNARRAHLTKPGPWKHIKDNMFDWINIMKTKKDINRSAFGGDLDSKNVPIEWAKGNIDIILVHLIRDIMWLVESDNENRIIKENKNILWNDFKNDTKFALKYLKED